MSKSQKRQKTLYRCQSCAHTETRWMGKCPACGEWGTLVEEAVASGRAASASIAAPDEAMPVRVDQVGALDEADDKHTRLACGIGEVDRVLGGGLVPGAFVLLGGDPGVGKSTLLVQTLKGIADAVAERDGSVLYVSGEESVRQTAMRARRVDAVSPQLSLLAEINLGRILEHAKRMQPAVLAIDSIQTIFTDELESIPGSVGQVRECAGRLMHFAKSTGIPTILVGHVTKGGQIAGPKTLEHVVDAVIYFEGEGGSPYRILRAHKNRFGSTQEMGVFEMRASGLCEVQNPSELFLAERPMGAPGSVVVASAEGSRPILVEVQALVAPPSAGVGRRTAAGVDGNRLALLLAVLAQRANCDVLSEDVFVNVAGGLRVAEPAIDLGVACAVASSALGRAVDARTVMFGEVGLTGEVRAVNFADLRLAEAAKLGFQRCLLPKQNSLRLEADHGLELIAVSRLTEALERL
ncbi:DNA repair protein RadA [Haliangium ochraceum]|uniref:DNA repair protein RadA n=1 Tax=Haliangium ochraceum (strain DSM 14365 / JCM 11303 / SMP-2) TaxID=502025 RepID=D0LSI5_HALO1|nr:DNA repair protein RadA [Haliangium ochraceum]ACY15684.1 DNA repair protein RadA [Haliangium ochraceum DSM 14365]